MVSAATTMQEEHGGSGSGRPQPLDNKILSETVKGVAVSEQLNPEDEIIPKVRKPYTVTKQRERWTEEEHKKFLEALKLYGRAWWKIEEHVGSKTAVQIRSHAQKFFSKITRETEVGDESSLKPIEIPPPRPKKKPLHPYPRKMVPLAKPGIELNRFLSADTSVSDNENHSSSPTSVLSVIGSDDTPNGSVKEGSSKPSDDAENSSEDGQVLDLLPHNNCGQFLKLFGKTLLVADAQTEACTPEQIYTGERNNRPDLPWLTLYSGTQGVLSPTAVKASKKTGEVDNESSCDPSDEERSRAVESSREFKGQVKNLISSYKLSKRVSAGSLKGFVPYKRCIVDRDSDASSADQRDKQRIRIEAM